VNSSSPAAQGKPPACFSGQLFQVLVEKKGDHGADHHDAAENDEQLPESVARMKRSEMRERNR